MFILKIIDNLIVKFKANFIDEYVEYRDIFSEEFYQSLWGILQGGKSMMYSLSFVS